MNPARCKTDKDFLPFCGLPFCATVSFAVQMVCNSTEPCLSIVDLMPWAARFLFRKSEAVPVSCRVFLTLSSTIMRHSGFYVQGFGPSGIDLQGGRWGSSWILLHATLPSFPASFVKEAVFSLVSSAIFVKNQVTRMCGLTSGSSVPFHWSTCLFMTVPCRFYYHGSVVYLKVG